MSNNTLCVFHLALEAALREESHNTMGQRPQRQEREGLEAQRAHLRR